MALTGRAAATATSGLGITYSVVSGPATLSGSTLTLTGSGTVTVRAAQAGNATYAPAESVDRSFIVSGAKSSDATLAGLQVKNATLSPNFKRGTTGYTVSVPIKTKAVKVKATASHVAATIKINGTTVKSGTLSAAIPLKADKNVIKVAVTAQNGSLKTYKITISKIRPQQAPARLDALATSMTKSPAEAMVSEVMHDGHTYLQLTTRSNPRTPKPVIEVSSNLVDWFRGDKHTTTLVDDGRILKVRDNTPITPEAKRFIQVIER